jgi:predicted NACHT family NTPase
MRIVRQIKTRASRPEEVARRPFSDFGDRKSIVLLGDPGAGKTHLFREAASAERARFVRTRDLLNVPATHLHGQALYIDGLDEKRAGRGDQDTIDRLVVKLFEIAPPRVRISCRAADWLGESDLAAMASFFDQLGDTCVLHLEGLSRDEQISVLVDQGAGTDEAERFLKDAMERGLEDFLYNPQNLIMLRRAVQTGAWPSTRKELFELSTQLMLRESNSERARSGSGALSSAELRPVAGAICAARLISDVDAINLSDQEGTSDIPSYRSMVLFAPEAVQAALGRRVFDAASEPETVDYAHRTTAEFLAAESLATRVREGLSFGRVAALMGVDGHPASELRGLHSWLAVHLPEHADELIEADPYGVLTYGDAASLSTASCAALVRALDKLSQKNPWFRSGNRQERPIGALARPDMVEEFRAILNNAGSGFGVRSVVMDALALGTPLPEMLSDLEIVLGRQDSPVGERMRALDALLRLGDTGKAAIRKAVTASIDSSENSLQVRAAIIEVLYGDPYGPDDVITLVQAFLTSNNIVSTGMLWSLSNALPQADLPQVLDGIEPPATPDASLDRNSREVGRFYSRILVRAWSSVDPFEPVRVLGWLGKRVAFKSGAIASSASDLRAAMRSTPERLQALAEDFFSRVPVVEKGGAEFRRFHEAILFELDSAALAAIALRKFTSTEAGSDHRLYLYEVALSLSFQLELTRGAALFSELWQHADGDPALDALRETRKVVHLPENYFPDRPRRPPQEQNHRALQQEEFDEKIDQIRTGQHLGWLKHLAHIYFGLYNDVDLALSPRDRVAAWLGEERTAAALEALAATLTRNDLPSFESVMSLAADHQRYDWWYALVAGLNERWELRQSFGDLSDDFLKALLIFDIDNPVSMQKSGSEHDVIHPWRTALMETRPELVRDAYLALARLRLSRGAQVVDGLRELLSESTLAPYSSAVAIELLRQFPNADQFNLGSLLRTVIASPSTHEPFLQLAGPIVSGAVPVDQRQRHLWLVTAYIVAPAEYERHVEEHAATHPDLVFDLRDRSGFARRDEPTQQLPLKVLEFMARLTGVHFPDTPHPVGSWSGDTNPWDASEYFRALTNMISASPSSAATDALQRLETDPSLTSYKPHLLYALDNQRTRRRESEYDRPNWSQTVAALANRAPATVADLHALLSAQFHDVAHRVARTNTDIFKQFWNLDSYSKPTVPRPEESCRDVVVTLLRPILLPIGITVEPEVHMVADKRADIVAAMLGRKIFCELKRDYHADVWTAISGQLERFYAHDPESKGYGIYVVFWFGVGRPRPIPAPPDGRRRPVSAVEMQAMLFSLLREDMRHRIAIVVIDVSGDI